MPAPPTRAAALGEPGNGAVNVQALLLLLLSAHHHAQKERALKGMSLLCTFKLLFRKDQEAQ